jgi:hypothetical protein
MNETFASTAFALGQEFSVDVTAIQLTILVETLKEAREMVENWGAYATEYYQEKWNLAGNLAFLDDVINLADRYIVAQQTK